MTGVVGRLDKLLSPGDAVMADVVGRLPWRCRHGWHDLRRVRTEGNPMSNHRHERHTTVLIEKCRRCGTEFRTEIFHSRSFWDDFNREVEDRRLEDVIRRATR